MNYVDNTVDGFLAVAQHPAAVGQVINVGSGREISIGDLARLIVQMLGSSSEVVEDSQRIRPAASEVERLLCGHAKARELLGWAPRVGLEEGLQRSIDWYRGHLDRYKTDIYNI